MNDGLYETAPVRAVRLQDTRCVCGMPLRWVGVRRNQPQPDEGSYTMCPRCYTIYQLGPDWTLTKPAQKNIPVDVLSIRDAQIALQANAQKAKV